jgi:hypothetical protein
MKEQKSWGKWRMVFAVATVLFLFMSLPVTGSEDQIHYANLGELHPDEYDEKFAGMQTYVAYNLEGKIAVLAVAPKDFQMNTDWQALTGIGDIEEIRQQISSRCNEYGMGASSWHSFKSGTELFFYTCGPVEKIIKKEREPIQLSNIVNPNVFPAIKNKRPNKDRGGSSSEGSTGTGGAAAGGGGASGNR